MCSVCDNNQREHGAPSGRWIFLALLRAENLLLTVT